MVSLVMSPEAERSASSDINSSLPMQYNTTNFKELFKLNSMNQYDIIDWVIANDVDK
jgi:hypothetical protein